MVQDPMSSSLGLGNVARQGELIYESIKDQYEPHQNGRYLAIEIEGRNAYLGETSLAAVEQAKLAHPGKVFFLVKIGYQSLESVAKSILEKRKKV